jgi:Rrf2 family protein
MKLSRSVSYAVGILLRVHGGGTGPMTAAQIAQGGKFPPRFLYRVLRRLVASGVLRGASGPGGGYSLARPARRINLLDIIQAVEGDHPPRPLPAVHPRYRRALSAIDAVNRRQAAATRREFRKLSLDRLARL